MSVQPKSRTQSADPALDPADVPAKLPTHTRASSVNLPLRKAYAVLGIAGSTKSTLTSMAKPGTGSESDSKAQATPSKSPAKKIPKMEGDFTDLNALSLDGVAGKG